MNIVSETLTKLVLDLTDSELDQLMSSGSTRTIRDNRNGKYYELILPYENDCGKITATFRHCDPPQMFEIVKTTASVAENKLSNEEKNIMDQEQKARYETLTPEEKAARAKYWRKFRGEDTFTWQVGNFVGLAKKPIRKVTGAVKSQLEIFMRGYRNRF